MVRDEEIELIVVLKQRGEMIVPALNYRLKVKDSCTLKVIANDRYNSIMKKRKAKVISLTLDILSRLSQEKRIKEKNFRPFETPTQKKNLTSLSNERELGLCGVCQQLCFPSLYGCATRKLPIFNILILN